MQVFPLLSNQSALICLSVASQHVPTCFVFFHSMGGSLHVQNFSVFVRTFVNLFFFRWSALQEEMRLDMQRIWKRNLGRDDRCISDHGKEVA